MIGNIIAIMLTMISASNTLEDVLLKHQPESNLLIDNTAISVVKNLTTPLQITLSVPLRDSKELIRAFYDIGVTCSYAELLYAFQEISCKC